MRTPIYVRPLTNAERETLEAGLHSSDAFVPRRSQIVLESAQRKLAPEIAENLHCHADTVRNAIHAFNAQGVAALQEGSSTPHTIHAAFRGPQAEHLRALLHRSPRIFGKPTSLWTLELAAEVSFEQGLTPARVSGETIRATLARLGIRWQRAKRWITSPDPEYTRKKGRATV
jgi:transposase